MEEYLRNEWRLSNHVRYQHLFEQWFNNLTREQKLYYIAYSRDKKSPYTYEEK